MYPERKAAENAEIAKGQVLFSKPLLSDTLVSARLRHLKVSGVLSMVVTSSRASI